MCYSTLDRGSKLQLPVSYVTRGETTGTLQRAVLPSLLDIVLVFLHLVVSTVYTPVSFSDEKKR